MTVLQSQKLFLSMCSNIEKKLISKNSLTNINLSRAIGLKQDNITVQAGVSILSKVSAFAE